VCPPFFAFALCCFHLCLSFSYSFSFFLVSQSQYTDEERSSFARLLESLYKQLTAIKPRNKETAETFSSLFENGLLYDFSLFLLVTFLIILLRSSYS
jgi:hypothetical protein